MLVDHQPLRDYHTIQDGGLDRVFAVAADHYDHSKRTALGVDSNIPNCPIIFPNTCHRFLRHDDAACWSDEWSDVRSKQHDRCCQLVVRNITGSRAAINPGFEGDRCVFWVRQRRCVCARCCEWRDPCVAVHDDCGYSRSRHPSC